jgi:CRP-like cAMP-binding protein
LGVPVLKNRPVPAFSGIQCWHKIRSLSWLSPRQLDKLSQTIRIERYKKHSLINAHGICFLLSGVARLIHLKPGRGWKLAAYYARGDTFGDYFRFAGMSHPEIFRARVETVTECLVGRVDGQRFIEDILGLPYATFQRALDMTSAGAWKIILRYSGFIGERVQSRLAELLLELGSQFGVGDSRGTILNVKSLRKTWPN